MRCHPRGSVAVDSGCGVEFPAGDGTVTYTATYTDDPGWQGPSGGNSIAVTAAGAASASANDNTLIPGVAPSVGIARIYGDGAQSGFTGKTPRMPAEIEPGGFRMI